MRGGAKRNPAVPYRDVKLRDECLKKYGRVCAVCSFDGSKYGISPNAVIEVHHKNPIKNGVRKTTVDDSVPVCPNPPIKRYTLKTVSRRTRLKNSKK